MINSAHESEYNVYSGSLFGGTPLSIIFLVCSCALVFRQHMIPPQESLMKPSRRRMLAKNPMKPWAPIDSRTMKKRVSPMGPGAYMVGGPDIEHCANDLAFSSSSH